MSLQDDDRLILGCVYRSADSREEDNTHFVEGLINTCQMNFNRCDGSVGRASASQSEGRWFEPRPSHTKDFKNGTRCLSLLALEK